LWERDSAAGFGAAIAGFRIVVDKMVQAFQGNGRFGREARQEVATSCAESCWPGNALGPRDGVPAGLAAATLILRRHAGEAAKAAAGHRLWGSDGASYVQYA